MLRWNCSYEDALGRTIAETRPGFNGALLITSNEYNTANQLIASCSYSLDENLHLHLCTYTYFCYNSLGERNLTVSDMNLNSQIDWNDAEGRVLAQRGATYPVDYTYDEYGNKASI